MFDLGEGKFGVIIKNYYQQIVPNFLINCINSFFYFPQSKIS